MGYFVDNAPRLIYIGFSLYALAVLLTRWQVTRVMTQDRRFLLLFFTLEIVTSIISGTVKTLHDAPVDVSSWITVLTQSFLAAYLYYSVPASYRRAHHWITRRPR